MILRSMILRPMFRPNAILSNIIWNTRPLAHQPTCPSRRNKTSGTGGKLPFHRAERSAKCKLLIFPEEWFKFFHVKTGVSGFYVLLIGICNYSLSKEIFVMEHEYYTGLSIAIMLYVACTKFGPNIGKSLDQEVDAIRESWYTGRKQEIAFQEDVIKSLQLAQKRAQGMKSLMDAKKENVLMQLEAVYRERAMYAYRAVRGRMDYHIKLHQALNRIHQKWMVKWIIDNVLKSITPQFEAAAMDQAIKDIEIVASRAK